MRQQSRYWFVATLLATSAIRAAAAPIYAVYDNDFGTVNSATGVFSPVGTLPFTQTAGIAFFRNTLFAQSLQGELISINPVSGSASVVAKAGSSPVAFGGGSTGMFEIDSRADLYSINPDNGKPVLVEATKLQIDGDTDTSLAESGISLYFTAGRPGADDTLYRINTRTGITADLGSTGVADVTGSAIVNGDLELIQDIDGAERIYSAAIGATNFTAGPLIELPPSGSRIVAPEPGSFLLLGVSLIGVGLLRRGKKAAE